MDFLMGMAFLALLSPCPAAFSFVLQALSSFLTVNHETTLYAHK
jgi:hypothetical protein